MKAKENNLKVLQIVLNHLHNNVISINDIENGLKIGYNGEELFFYYEKDNFVCEYNDYSCYIDYNTVIELVFNANNDYIYFVAQIEAYILDNI